MTNQSEELKQACRNLRVGDVVTIHLNHYPKDDPKSVPFTVKLTKVTNREEYSTYNSKTYVKTAPLIEWQSRGEIDQLKMSVSGDVIDSAYCDAGFVTEIVSKAPYKMAKMNVRNRFYERHLRMEEVNRQKGRPNSDFSSRTEKAPVYIVHSITTFAEILLSFDPALDLPYGLSSERLRAEWAKAGYPGLKGGFKWSDDSFTPHYPHNLYDNGSISLSRIVEMVVHRGQFKAWVLRNVARLKKTKKELRQEMRESADRERRNYEADMAYDFDRSWADKHDEQEDTFESHLEEMIDWD